LAGGVVGTSIAAFPADDVKLYTGCLTSGGTLVSVAEGNNPKTNCDSPKQVVKLSGGDITSVSVGSGLTGGGTNGAVTVGLNAQQTLPSCSNGQVPKWNGTAWACGTDNNTTYGAGTGLDLDTSTTPDRFEIESAYRLPGKSCTAPNFSRGFDSSGDVVCAAPTAPTSAGIEVWQKVNPAVPASGVIFLPKGEGVDVIIMPLPAGTFLITAVAAVSDNSDDDEVHVSCRLRNGAFLPLPVHGATVDIGDGSGNDPEGVVTVHGVITLANPDSVRFTCTSSAGDDDEDDAIATMTAVKVGTVHTP
jgi:hypothetical protein